MFLMENKLKQSGSHFPNVVVSFVVQCYATPVHIDRSEASLKYIQMRVVTV